MENFEDLKNSLIHLISKSSDQNLIFKLWELMNMENTNSVSGPQSHYESEKPMTEEEVEDYFREEEIILPPAVLKMIERGMNDVKNRGVYTEDEMEKMDEEWLN
ncbi:hypothetical protein [Kaistella jeonii]|nr:hypothetical protein [Kaistella jeonii]